MTVDIIAGLVSVLTGSFTLLSTGLSSAIELIYETDALTPFGEVVVLVVGIPTAFAITNWVVNKLGGLRKIFSGAKK